MAPPNSDDLAALETARRQLQSLVTSMSSLRRDLETHDPLPSYPSLLTTASLIALNLSSLSTHLAAHADFFNAAHITPLPSFPGRAQEALLQQLTRKKLEPGVGEWLEAGVRRAQRVGEGSEASGMGMPREQREELWRWVSPAAQEIARKILVEGGAGDEDGDEDDGEDEDEDDEDDDEKDAGQGYKMDVDVPGGVAGSVKNAAAVDASRGKGMMSLEDIYRFVSTGVVPTQSQPR